jgi:PrtD family type I secretion system ABC transporter
VQPRPPKVSGAPAGNPSNPAAAQGPAPASATGNETAAPAEATANPSADTVTASAASRLAAVSGGASAVSSWRGGKSDNPKGGTEPTDGRDPIASVKAVCRAALKPVSLFSFVINLLMLTGPLFMLQVYDRALPSGSVPTLVILFVLVSVLYLFFAMLEGVRGRIFIRLGTRIDEILHRPLYRATLDPGGQNGAASASSPLRDLDAVRNYVAGPGPAAFFDVPWVPVYLALIFALHPLLGLFATLAAALLVIVAIVNKRSTHQGHADSARAAETAQRLADEGRRQAPAIQALGMTETLVDQWAVRKAEARRLVSAVSDRAGLLGSASKSMRLYFQSAMLALGAWLAIEQAISAGMIIAATIIMARALAPIEQIVQQWRMLAGAQRSWGRIKTLFDSLPAQAPRTTILPAPSGAIRVAGLNCLVNGSKKPILAGIAFEIEPGAGLGIIGPSGAGKSTLIKALLGIWPSVSGEVRLDGATHDQWDRAELGRYFGYLPQGAVLLPGTIAENISRFAENPPSEAILQAAKVTGVHQLAVSFENGYDTMVGPGGVQLSAGQAQRVALARAVYGMPPIVVLDEPYSNLDADGEQALAESIKTLRAHGSTVIVVAHRASALNALDTILCLRDGRQAFFGPKDSVLRAMTQAVQSENTAQPRIGQGGSGGSDPESGSESGSGIRQVV